MCHSFFSHVSQPARGRDLRDMPRAQIAVWPVASRVYLVLSDYMA